MIYFQKGSLNVMELHAYQIKPHRRAHTSKDRKPVRKCTLDRDQKTTAFREQAATRGEDSLTSYEAETFTTPRVSDLRVKVRPTAATDVSNDDGGNDGDEETDTPEAARSKYDISQRSSKRIKECLDKLPCTSAANKVLCDSKRIIYLCFTVYYHMYRSIPKSEDLVRLTQIMGTYDPDYEELRILRKRKVAARSVNPEEIESKEKRAVFSDKMMSIQAYISNKDGILSSSNSSQQPGASFVASMPRRNRHSTSNIHAALLDMGMTKDAPLKQIFVYIRDDRKLHSYLLCVRSDLLTPEQLFSGMLIEDKVYILYKKFQCEKRMQAIKRKNACYVCKDRKLEWLNMDCRHVYCADCVRDAVTCPVRDCNMEIEGKLQYCCQY